MESKATLERFCYLGSFLPTYLRHKGHINDTEISAVLRLAKTLKGDELLAIVDKCLKHGNLPRKDELWLLVAAFLASDVPIAEKDKVKAAFPNHAKGQEDLFCFAFYSKKLLDLQEKNGFSKTTRKAITLWYQHQNSMKLVDMMGCNQGLYGYRHKDLISLCHVNLTKLDKKDLVAGFFSRSNQIVERNPEESFDTLPPAVKKLTLISKLKICEDPNIAAKLIKDHNLKLEMVPSHMLANIVIWEALMPSLKCRQLLERLAFVHDHKMLGNKTFSKIFITALGNTENIRNEKIHPIAFLVEWKKHAKQQRYSEKIKTCYYAKKVQRLGLKPNQSLNTKLPKIFHNSFKNIETLGIRVFITINLQTNYRKKCCSAQKQVTCFEAALTLAYSYYTSEKNAVVYTYTEDSKKIKQVPWPKDATYQQAEQIATENTSAKNHQAPYLPLLEATTKGEVYDLFLTIVPSIARQNPGQKPDNVLTHLHNYRSLKNPRARMVFVNLRRFKPAMIHSLDQKDGILEISSFDENTPRLINAFALNLFS